LSNKCSFFVIEVIRVSLFRLPRIETN